MFEDYINNFFQKEIKLWLALAVRLALLCCISFPIAKLIKLNRWEHSVKHWGTNATYTDYSHTYSYTLPWEQHRRYIRFTKTQKGISDLQKHKKGNMSPEHEKIILEKLEWVFTEDRKHINEQYSSTFHKLNELLIDRLPDSYKHKIPCPDCGKDWGHSYCPTCLGEGNLGMEVKPAC